MKAVMISIQPKWCELIANGKKTIEVRKTKPKIETPFKCYIYQTKAKRRLIAVIKEGDDVYGTTYHGKPAFIKVTEDSYSYGLFGREGKVIGEFVCDAIDYRHCDEHDFDTIDLETLSELSCVKQDDLLDYADRGSLYGWHISDLVIYDEPIELSEFKAYNRKCYFGDLGLATPKCQKCNACNLTRPFQSWGYVEEREVGR